jgi:hypothetical protein
MLVLLTLWGSTPPICGATHSLKLNAMRVRSRTDVAEPSAQDVLMCIKVTHHCRDDRVVTIDDVNRKEN